jgi:hypothetical protein
VVTKKRMDGGTAMESGNLIVKDEGHLTRITLNRPEKRNALSHGLLSEMIPALRSVTTPVVAIEGAGPCLSAGHDLSEMTGRPLSFYQELGAICTEVMETIQGISSRSSPRSTASPPPPGASWSPPATSPWRPRAPGSPPRG